MVAAADPAGQVTAVPTVVEQIAAVAVNPATGKLSPARMVAAAQQLMPGAAAAEVVETVLNAAELARPGGDREARRAAVEKQLAATVA